MPSPLIGPSYNLGSRPASVQRTINLIPVPLEPGNERTDWTLKDAPGLRALDVSVSFDIAWNDDVYDSGDTSTIGNNGTGDTGSGIQLLYYASVVGGTSETVSWSSNWTPTGSDPSPTVNDLGGGIVEVVYTATSFELDQEGLLVISAAIGSSSANQTIEISTTNDGFGYTQIAWQQTP